MLLPRSGRHRVWLVGLGLALLSLLSLSSARAARLVVVNGSSLADPDDSS